jgi:hypothetical protein
VFAVGNLFGPLVLGRFSITTFQCQRDQGRRSRRDGICVRIVPVCTVLLMFPPP